MSSSKRNSSKGFNRRRGRGSKGKRIDPKKFWGDAKLVDDLIDGQTKAVMVNDPSAVWRSLGKVPLVWLDDDVNQKLSSVYDRASMLAGALAAAGDLIELEDLEL